jgi:CRP-like cAMP-binding protein
MSVRADAETLRRIPIFQNCDAVPLQILAFASERLSAGERDVLLEQGVFTDSAYLVLNGGFSLARDGVEVGRAEPGAFLGETAMIGRSASSITAIATELSYVARISHATFTKVAQEYPEFGEMVLRTLNRRVQTTLAELETVREMMLDAKSFSDL